MRRVAVLLFALVVALSAAAPALAGGRKGGSDGRLAAHSLRSPVSDQSFYFVMADRFENGDPANDLGGLPADRLVSGFDPTATGFYHGGDLKGLLQRIDYIRGLGATSIWLTPTFKNKAVQLEDGPSAGYHGYWITDFTQIDPHLGTNEDLRALVEAAHTRGMKVYFDIIANHTADVIGYEEGARQPYVSKDDEPYRTADGAIFDDRDYAGSLLFPALDPDVSFPYVPVLDPAEEHLKVPDWLNDVTLYHNRGDTTFVGENSLYGDFFGLDDLFTENPRVVQGMIDIYETWIADFGVDGFRIDTMKHVDDAFWQRFGPEVLAFARAHGKREFFMFGEVFDTTKSFTSHFTTTDRMQAVLDFPFQAAAQRFAASSAPTDDLRAFFAGDDWYTDADSNVYQLPTFLGNHDMGRIGLFVRNANAGATDAEVLARDRLAHELMYLSRGNPVVYYGDEQGFVGDGGDQAARQDMFPSQVASYNDDDLIGTDATTADSNFDPTHPLYRAIARLSHLTQKHEALRDGAQIHRLSSTAAGIYAFSRIDRRDQREYVVVLNNSEQPQTATIPTYSAKRDYLRIYGDGRRWLESNRSAGLTVTVQPLSAVVYKLWGEIPRSKKAPRISLADPAASAESNARIEVGATVDGTSFYEVTFLARVGRGPWTRHRHGRQPAVPRLPRRHEPAGRHVGALQGDRPRQRAPHAHVGPEDGRRARPEGDDRGAGRGQQGARHRRAQRRRRPGARHARRPLRAHAGRRRVDAGRHRRLVAHLLGDRRHLGARPRRGHPDPLPRRADRARRHDVDERRADGDRCRPAAGDRRGALLPARRRLHGLGPAPLGRRGRSGRAGPGRVGPSVAADQPRGRLGALRDPARGRHQGGQLHHAPAERRLGARHAGAGRRPLVRPARPPGDLAQAGRPDGVLRAAAGAVGPRERVEGRRGRRGDGGRAGVVRGSGRRARPLDGGAVGLVGLLEGEGVRRRAVGADVVDAREGLVDGRQRAGLDPPQRHVHLRRGGRTTRAGAAAPPGGASGTRSPTGPRATPRRRG